MLNESQLARINHIRTSSGRNPVTMEQAEIMISDMNETDRARALWAINREIGVTIPQTCEERIAAAVAAERERCVKILESASFHGDMEDERDGDIAEVVALMRSGQ